MITKVYKYGLLAPTTNSDLVRSQMRSAHTFRNDLVSIERGYREYKRSVLEASLRPHIDVIAASYKAITTAEDAIKAYRISARTKKSTPKPLKDALKLAKSNLVDAKIAFKTAKAKLIETPQYIVELAELEQAKKILAKAAYNLSNLPWGTRALVTEAMAKSAMTSKDMPKFIAWRNVKHHHIGVQIQNENRLDNYLQIVSSPKIDNRRGRRAGQYRVLRMRVGTDEQGPVWAEWPMVLHRPIPDGAKILSACVTMTPEGPRERWTTEVTIRMASVIEVVPANGEVAINIGWRQREGGLRVAYWRDDQGNHGEIMLGDNIIGHIHRPETLRSTRDKNLNEMAPKFAAWLKDNTLPGWLKEATSHIHMWKNQARFASLARRWKDNRFEGDAEGYDLLEGWRYHDFHLWQWEVSSRRKSLGHRREWYRIVARMLANTYKTVVLQKHDKRETAKLPSIENEAWTNETARSNRVVASVSQFEQCIKQAFHNRVVTVESEYNTRRCNVCKDIDKEWNPASGIEHTCSACGAEWDQDNNACMNILERFSDVPNPASARKSKKVSDIKVIVVDRYTRRKEAMAAKEAKIAAARKAVANSMNA